MEMVRHVYRIWLACRYSRAKGETKVLEGWRFSLRLKQGSPSNLGERQFLPCENRLKH